MMISFLGYWLTRGRGLPRTLADQLLEAVGW
jgi:hypothetical protein